MADELERIWKEAIVFQLSYYIGVCLEGRKKTLQSRSLDSSCPG
jgi:hypothetical protein